MMSVGVDPLFTPREGCLLWVWTSVHTPKNEKRRLSPAFFIAFQSGLRPS